MNALYIDIYVDKTTRSKNKRERTRTMEKKGFKDISANAQFTTHDTTIPKNAPLTNPLINVLDIMNLGILIERYFLYDNV